MDLQKSNKTKHQQTNKQKVKSPLGDVLNVFWNNVIERQSSQKSAAIICSLAETHRIQLAKF